MKKNKRVGLILEELISNPCRIFDSKFFCNKYDIAKSSLSEDIQLINSILTENGSGRIESIRGAAGGFRFLPGISSEETTQLQMKLIQELEDTSRLLGGKYLYTSDVMFNGQYAMGMGRIFASKFSNTAADYVVTVETKGIAIAMQTALLLNLPLVVIRREAKYSEGSTISINYFSGTNDRIQKMSIARRAVEPGKKAIIIDDFMRGGGSVKGIVDILNECGVETLGIGVALASSVPEKKKVNDYTSIIIVDDIDEDKKTITLRPNNMI